MPLTAEEQTAADLALAAATKASAADAVKALLTELGVESADALKTTIKTANDALQANKTAEQKQAERLAALETENKTLAADTASARATALALTLKSDAEEVAAELKVTPAKARQILKLLPDFEANKYDTEKGKSDLKTRFEKFLAEPDNKHFIGSTAGAEGSSRKPDAAGANAQQGEFAKLRELVTAAPIQKK